jgi:hypothetical protein
MLKNCRITGSLSTSSLQHMKGMQCSSGDTAATLYQYFLSFGAVTKPLMRFFRILKHITYAKFRILKSVANMFLVKGAVGATPSEYSFSYDPSVVRRA